MLGFWRVLVNPLGPVQLYVPPATAVALSWSVPPAHSRIGLDPHVNDREPGDRADRDTHGVEARVRELGVLLDRALHGARETIGVEVRRAAGDGGGGVRVSRPPVRGAGHASREQLDG